jgi:hypothetical protein
MVLRYHDSEACNYNFTYIILFDTEFQLLKYYFTRDIAKVEKTQYNNYLLYCYEGY